MFSPTSLAVLAVPIAGAVALAAGATRALRQGKGKRVAALVAGTAVLATSAVGLQLNRVTYHVESWGGLAKAIFSPPPDPEPLPFAEKPRVWDGETDPTYRVEKTPFTPHGVKNPAGTFYAVKYRGPQSGLSLPVTVWMPAGADNARDLAVLEILPGFPGNPPAIPRQLDLDRVLSTAIDAGAMPPTAVVIPHVALDRLEPDGFDLPGRPKIGTWIARDVPAMMAANFPVSREPAKWTIGGMSAGGYIGPALGAYTPDTFGNILFFSGSNEPELGGLVHSSDAVKTQYSVVNLIKRRPDMNVWAYATGHEYGGTRTLVGLADLATVGERTGSTALVFDQKAIHNWDTWGRVFPQAVDWLGTVLGGQRADSVDLPAAARTVAEARGPGRGGIYAVIGAVVALGAAGLGGRWWYWRRRGAGTDPVAGSGESLGVGLGAAGENRTGRAGSWTKAVAPASGGSWLSRLLIWDGGAVLLGVIGGTLLLVALANLRMEIVRNQDDLLTLLIFLGYNY